MSVQTSSYEPSLSAMPEIEKNKLLKNYNENTALSSQSILIPSVVTVSYNGEKYSILFEEKLGGKIWGICKDYLKYADSQNIYKKNFENEAEKDSFLKSVSNMNDYIYFKLRREINGAVLFAITAGSESAFGSEMSVKNVFIYGDDSGRLCFCFIDSAGDVYEIFCDKGLFNKEALSAYNYKTEFISSDIVVNNGNVISLFKSSVSNEKMLLNVRDDYFGYIPETKESEELLRMFGFNPNNTRYFRSMGNYTFVENSNEIEVSPTGKIVFNTEEDGIDLKNILGYTPNSNDGIYAFSEKIYALRYLINKFFNIYSNNKAILNLYDVSFDNHGYLTFKMEYVVNGKPVEDSELVSTVVFKDNCLVYAELYCLDFEVIPQNIPLLPMNKAYSLALSEYGPDVDDFNIVFSLSDTENEFKYYLPVFVTDVTGDNYKEVENYESY